MAADIIVPERGVAYAPAAELAEAVKGAYDAAADLSAPLARDLAWLATGLTKQEISALSAKAVGTIRNNQVNIAQKLKVPNNIEILTVVAHASGWFGDYGLQTAPDEHPYEYPYDANVLRVGEQKLSPRERQVLGMKVSGKTGQQIGGELDISANTVKNTQTRIIDRLFDGTLHTARSMHTVIAAMWMEDLVIINPVKSRRGRSVRRNR